MLSTSTNGTHVLFSNVGSEKFHFLFALSFTHEKLCISDRLVCVPMGHRCGAGSIGNANVFYPGVYITAHFTAISIVGLLRKKRLSHRKRRRVRVDHELGQIHRNLDTSLMIVMMVSWCKPHALWE